MSRVMSDPWCSGVIPPYMLDRLTRHASPRVRQRALSTLRLEAQARSLRATATAAPAGTRAPATAVSPPGQVSRAVHSATNGTVLPGLLVRAEGQPPSGDPAVDEAYEHLGATYDMFWQVYRRHSIDNAGLPLVGTVHYGEDYDNAFWNGAQMVFGDGDGEVFNRFTVAVDIVGHELSHGVIDHEAGLRYQGQSGALNESLSDVFGSLVKQHRAGQTADQADWLIGAGLFTSAVNARALRSMAQPGSAYDDPALGKDPQPAHMQDYVDTTDDNGGVHINSGIPNRAFYLAATALGGPAWQRAGRVWYDALRDKRLGAQADFASFATLTLEAASADAATRQAVREAWRQVGVLP
ncbi:M4 family metallopeptidase [Bordetella petrii]|uniref:Neutral metalloproteinase n=1 Tax=Bordetella petrii (strain ATCC BAA-461 / DSM 12804 / CCUG 43448 / CIP 107267 / Se-1111R) TaxID=340100 RepID=A9IND3_BORPD|nr:M4 family metallopeptidase [Bordetella petrii]CAP42821.1 putative metalloprotease [Bordetella petrii]